MKLLAKLLLILSLGAPLSLCRALPCPAQEAKNRAQAGTQQAAPEERALPEKQAPDNDEASISIEEDIIAQSMPSYMYSLKRLIGEAKKNIQRVEREIKQRSFFIKNLPTETKIRDHFEKGNELYEKGELKDARKEWDKALEITKEPEIKRYLEKSEEIAREQEYYKKLEEQEHRREMLRQAKPLYKKAVSLYRKRRYGDAMLMFQKVDAMAPDYSGTNYYMNRIRKIVEKKGAAPEPEPLKKKKIRIRKEDLPEQIPPELPPTPEEKQKEEEKKILEQARALYEEAMLLYKCRNYSEAFGKFEEVRKIKPGYARTEYLIKRILDDIGEKQREEEKRRLRGAIDQLYEEARLSYKSGYFKEAEDIFRHILLLDPDEREAKAYVSRKIPEQMKKVSDREMRGVQERLEKARRKQLEWNRKKAIENKNEAAAAYKQALSLYKKKLYREAFGKFNEAQNMIPNYSRSEYYIKHIMAIIEKQQRREEAKMLDGAIGSLFKEGMMFYDNQHYDKALEIFEHILTLDPSHRGAKRYAEKQIPARIEEIKDKDKRHAEKYLKKERLERAKLERLNKLYTKKEAERLYDQAIACFKKKQYGAAMEKFESVQNLIPDYARSQDYLKRARLAIEQKWQREKEENEKKALEEKKMRADRMYREAILLYKDKKYKEAFEGFSDTQDMVPGYLDTDGYIEKIFRIIEKEGKKVTIRTKKEEKKEEKARALYDRARKLYKQRKYQEAMDKFNEANTVMPGYSHTDYYLQLIQGDMQREKELAEVKARQEENRQKIRQASMLYKQALSLYTRKKYEESLGKFKEVLDTIDGYGATYYYMQRIPRDIEKETRQKEEQSLTAVPAVDFTKSGFSLSVGK